MEESIQGVSQEFRNHLMAFQSEMKFGRKIQRRLQLVDPGCRFERRGKVDEKKS
jgi:hypothetical protein